MAEPKPGYAFHVKVQVSVDPFDIGEDFRYIVNGSAVAMMPNLTSGDLTEERAAQVRKAAAEFFARVQSVYGDS